MYDRTPAGSLSSLVKLEEGLKTYGLLESIRGSPDMWRPVFVPGCEPSVTATTFLIELVVDFSLSDVKKSSRKLTFSITSPTLSNHWIRLV